VGNSDLEAGLTLPPFVTAESVGELLNWANSIKRTVREAARKHPVGGWALAADCDDIYRDIVRLLRRLTGGYPLHLSGFGKTTDAVELMRVARESHEQRLGDPGTLADLLQDERLLGAARIVGQFNPADLAADLDSMGFAPGDCVAGHLERLGVVETVQDAGEARRRLNPLVATVLSHQS
jgi:hypothetical protein